MDTYGLLYGEDLKIYKIIYIVWISLIILSFINYEILYIDHLGREKYASLPDFTLDEFNDKVQKGSFFYTPPSVIKPNRKSGFGIIEKIDKLPIAALIDDFNRGNTIKSPLAVHSHTRGPFELGNRISSLSTHTTPIELQARGPFELGNRISLLSTHTTPIKSPITTGFLQQTSSQNDINVPAIPPTLIKYHLKHFNFNNMDNGNRLSMHLLYGNKSFGDQILNLKEQYMEPLYEKCIYDLSIIDSVLSVVYVFNELSPSNEEEEGELQQIKSAALEGKIDKKILKNWFKDIIINNESKSGEGKAEKRTRDSFDNVIPEISNNQLRSDSLNKPNSKIFVCGPMKMMNKIGGILSNDLKLNINDDYILLM
ncbi:6235_t:CDS:2 [Entrophospora sp. SA101]|nr:6235_t:CDS:2 [Entrophospora sp. SA101]